jgi:S-adenosylmethionine synthetase
MPAPIYFAHKILKVLSDKRRAGQLRPAAGRQDQVTVQYVNGKPVGCTKVVVSTHTTRKAATARSTRRA